MIERTKLRRHTVVASSNALARPWHPSKEAKIELSRWLAFLVASAAIGLLPGPGVANIVGHALASGRRTAFAAIAGAVAGNVVTMLVSAAGVGTLLKAFPGAFRLLGLGGAAYLIVLGLISVLASQAPVMAGAGAQSAIRPRTAFAGSVLVSALNPKSIIFFIAFVPQFVATSGNYLVQSAILLMTFASVVATTDALYAMLALRVANVMQSSKMAVWIRRAGGAVLIFTGLFAAAVG